MTPDFLSLVAASSHTATNTPHASACTRVGMSQLGRVPSLLAVEAPHVTVLDVRGALFSEWQRDQRADLRDRWTEDDER